MSEFVATFGPEKRLVGTLCLPEGPSRQAIAWVLTNAGVVPRMGPHRFNVKLARHLAQQGVVSLRLDLSGQGDSRPATTSNSYHDQTVKDLQAAMDHITATTGITQFAVAGICSGAIAGYNLAQQDTRVVGLWMLDGHVYANTQAKLIRIQRYLRSRLASGPGSWLKDIASRLHAWRLKPPAAPVDASSQPPARDQFAATLNDLVQRGVRIHLVYTAGVAREYGYHDQLRDTFKGHAFVDQVTLEHLPDIDHTITRLSAQQQVIESLGTWARQINSPRA